MDKAHFAFIMAVAAGWILVGAAATAGEGGSVFRARPETLSNFLETLSPGDTLLLEDGTYGPFTISVSGTRDAPIALKAAGDGAVVDAGGAVFAVKIDGDYIEVSGLAVRNARDYCIRSFGKKGLVIRDVDFSDFGVAAFMGFYCEDCIVENCRATGTAGAGIRFDNSTHITIRRNRIRMKTHYGLKLLTYYAEEDNPDPTVEVMTIVGNDISVEPMGPEYTDGDRAKGMMLWSIRDSLIKDNYIHSATSTGPGIVIGISEPIQDDPAMVCAGNIITGNVVDIPSSRGYCLWVQKASRDMRVTGNTFIGGGKGVLGIHPSCREGLASEGNVLVKVPGGIWIGDGNGGAAEGLDAWLAAGLDAESHFVDSEERPMEPEIP